MANWFQQENSRQTASATGTQDLNNPTVGYFYQPNGTGGVNYFKIVREGGLERKVPITNQEYKMGTGEDTNAIEQTTMQQYAQANPGPMSRPSDKPQWAIDQENAAASAATGGTGVGTTPVEPEYITMMVNGQMQQYDLADPNDRVRFYDDKLTMLNQQKEESLIKSGGVFDQNMADIEQEIADTQKAAKDYMASYEKGLAEFGEDYELGNVKRGQYFAGLSPNAFQSAQGTSALYGQNKYIEGVGDMARGAQEAVGEGYMADPNNFGAIGEGSTFGRAIGGLGREKANLQGGFQDYAKGLDQNIAEQAASEATKLSKLNAFDFSRTKSGTPTVGQTDLSAYTPFTQFTGQAAKTNVMPKVYTGNAFSETGLDAFLGRTKMNPQQTDLLRNYLMAR